eukprot:8856055-Karenia_brevis.AAC.1
MPDCGGVAWSHPCTPASSRCYHGASPLLSPLPGRSPRACQGEVDPVDGLDEVDCHDDGFGGGGGALE